MLGGFPLGLISSVLITSDAKLKLYLINYPVMLCALLCAVIVYNQV